MLALLLDAASVIKVVIYTLLIIAGLISLYILIYSISCLKVVEQSTSMIVERFGKFSRRLGPGLYYLVPFIDRPRYITWRTTETYMSTRGDERASSFEFRRDRIDLREAVMDFPMQVIITRDNVEIRIHPMLLYRLVDPIRVAYEVYDLPHAVEKLVQTSLRSIIGDMGLDDTLASREEINRILSQKIHSVCLNWGLEILKVEILEILPTPSIQRAMHEQIRAERLRRAAIIRADGEREKLRTVADGDAQARILRAKGRAKEAVLEAKGIAESKIIVASAEANALKSVGEALDEFGVDPAQYMIGLKYIEAFESLAGRADRRIVYFPYETSMSGSLATISN